jgi:hypothetical protein
MVCPLGKINFQYLQYYVFVPYLLIILFTFYSSYRKKKKAFKRLTDSALGSVSKSFFDPVLNGEYQGLKFRIYFFEGGKNSPPYLNIALFKRSSFKLNIYKESILSQLGAKAGLIHEPKISDELFDKEFLIFSNNSNMAAGFLGNEGIRRAVRELFGAGFDSLTVNGKSFSIKKPNCSFNDDFDPARVRAYLNSLSLLARGLL